MKITFEFETFESFKSIRFLIQLTTYYIYNTLWETR